MYLILLAGFGGGILRGIVGFTKHQFAYKDVKFNLPYFFFMTILSGTVGLTTAWVMKETGITFMDQPYLTPALSFIIGYAGGDFLENIYKIVLKEASLYSPIKK